jgi:hypothetical protein
VARPRWKSLCSCFISGHEYKFRTMNVRCTLAASRHFSSLSGSSMSEV